MNTITKAFSPFYDFARRKLHMDPAVVDHYLNDSGSATINNRTVILRDAHGRMHNANIGVGHRRHGTRWVNDFNSRAIKAT